MGLISRFKQAWTLLRCFEGNSRCQKRSFFIFLCEAALSLRRNVCTQPKFVEIFSLHLKEYLDNYHFLPLTEYSKWNMSTDKTILTRSGPNAIQSDKCYRTFYFLLILQHVRFVCCLKFIKSPQARSEISYQHSHQESLQDSSLSFFKGFFSDLHSKNLSRNGCLSWRVWR